MSNEAGVMFRWIKVPMKMESSRNFGFGRVREYGKVSNGYYNHKVALGVPGLPAGLKDIIQAYEGGKIYIR